MIFDNPLGLRIAYLLDLFLARLTRRRDSGRI